MSQPTKPPSFGEIDLGDEGESLDLAVERPKKQDPAPARPAGAAPAAARGAPKGIQITPPGARPPAEGQAARPRPAPAEDQPAPRPRTRPPRPEAEHEPKRSHAREIKIGLIVALCLGVIGGGVYGFLRWREGVKQAEEAQLKQLDQGSLDSLKNDALNKEKLGT
jgi:hypothetical protein